MRATIVVVDDHDGVRELLRTWLGGVFPNCEVLAAKTGEEGVDIVRERRPAIVIMDLKLPGMDGIAAARRVREEYPVTRVVILSLFGDDAYREEAQAAGVHAYVVKHQMHAALIPILRDLMPA